MFRKITSNRDPRDTLLSELQKEFKPYVNKVGGGLRQITERYPKFLFGAMVVNMMLSIILCFTVFRHNPPAKRPDKPSKVTISSPVVTGFGQIMQAGNTLRETIHLKGLVDSLSQKKTLSRRDSLLLDSALDKLQTLNNNVTPKLKP